jgi:hypothetical protein
VYFVKCGKTRFKYISVFFSLKLFTNWICENRRRRNVKLCGHFLTYRNTVSYYVLLTCLFVEEKKKTVNEESSINITAVTCYLIYSCEIPSSLNSCLCTEEMKYSILFSYGFNGS